MKIGTFFSPFYLAIMTAFTVPAGAALVDRGDGTIYDDQHRAYWIRDLSLLSNRTYAEQMLAIQYLNATNSTLPAPMGTQWHLASRANLEELWQLTPASDPYTPASQVRLRMITDLFLPAWDQDNGYALYYEGRFDEIASVDPGPGHNKATLVTGTAFAGVVNAFGLVAQSGAENDSSRGPFGAWVVATVPAPVPEPSAMILTIAGLILLRFRRTA